MVAYITTYKAATTVVHVVATFEVQATLFFRSTPVLPPYVADSLHTLTLLASPILFAALLHWYLRICRKY